MNDREVKTFKFDLKEVDEEEGVFTGYAATFSKNPDSYGDIIDPGAFKKTIKEAGKRVKILFNHSVMEPIGRPVELKEDEKGLFIKGKLSLGVQRAKEVLELMRDGVITEMSIGYNTIKDSWDSVTEIRHLKEIRLWDTSPVVFAANPEAVITGVKSEELEQFPDEHVCRLRSLGEFQEDSFRRIIRTSEGKKYGVIVGKLLGEESTTEQAYRYPKSVWDVEDAMVHSHDIGLFEAAKDAEPEATGDGTGEPLPEITDPPEEHTGEGIPPEDEPKDLNADGLAKAREAISALQALVESAEPEEPEESTPPEEAEDGAAELESAAASLKAMNEGFDIKKAGDRIEAMLDKIK